VVHSVLEQWLSRLDTAEFECEAVASEDSGQALAGTSGGASQWPRRATSWVIGGWWAEAATFGIQGCTRTRSACGRCSKRCSTSGAASCSTS